METKRNKTLKLAVIGMLCALTAVVTWVLPIPMPATKGYINFGDTVIFIAAATLGGIPAMIVGGLGSMLADIMGGYAHWALFTLVIKGLEGLLCGLLFVNLEKLNKKAAMLISMSLSALWMVAGYYFSGVVMYGWAGSLASIPGNLIQAVISVAVAYALWLIFDRIPPIVNFWERLK